VQLDGKTVLLTGATGGIGRALCHALAAQGARLLATARRQQPLDALRTELGSGTVTATYAVDLADENQLTELAREARANDVSVLINLCGINDLALFGTQSAARIRQLNELNLLVPMHLTHALTDHLNSRDEAMIVNVGSILGSIGCPGYVAYCASKFGLRGFSEALAREMTESATSVIYIAPRTTRTAMNSQRATDLNAALGNATDSADAVARQIVHAMQKKRRRVYIGYPEKLLVRLNGLLSSIVDLALGRQMPTVRRFLERNTTEEIPS
jgi:short-subunit dehydrogenase